MVLLIRHRVPSILCRDGAAMVKSHLACEARQQAISDTSLAFDHEMERGILTLGADEETTLHGQSKYWLKLEGR
jgi:hypothetical protein